MAVIKISSSFGTHIVQDCETVDIEKVVTPIDGSALDDFRCIADAVEDSSGDTEELD